MNQRIAFRLFPFLAVLAAAPAFGQSLSMVSGNGQMVSEQFLSNAPFVVVARDAAGKPAAGVAVTWAITQGSGTISLPQHTTDASGLATAGFLATNVPPGTSFFASTVTASTSAGSVNFVVTTVAGRQVGGGLAAPPLVELVSPPLENRNLTGASGSTLPAAVVVRVVAQSGLQLGQPVPNIGLRIGNNLDPTAPAAAACSGQNGLVLTDNTGTASCDLVITGTPGTAQVVGVVGESQNTPPINLTITQGVSCKYSLSAGSQSFGPNGGAGSVNVITTAGCGWTAVSNAPWARITAGASGSGSGTVNYTVDANTGPARTATLSIAGQTHTINESGAGSSTLAIASGSVLSSGTVGVAYSTTLVATGGVPPYTWATSGSLPGGLSLNAGTGVIAGTPAAPGTFGFSATVTDNAGAKQAQNFSITINASGGSSNLAITNVSFPAATVGQAYSQLLLATGGCITPFSPTPAFNLSGGSLPPGLSLQTNSDRTTSVAGTPSTAGTYNFSVTATDACAHSASAAFSITVSGGGVTTQQMTLGVTSLSFAVQAGAPNIPADQTFSVTSSSGTLNYNVAVSTNNGGPWLVLKSAATGSTPGSITVGVANYSSLAPGQYSGVVTITSAATNSPVTLQVGLTVVGAAAVSVSPVSFTVNQPPSGNNVSRQVIAVSSTGAVHFTATASTLSGGPWLSINPTDGTTPASITATISSAGMAPGNYSGTVVITPAGGAAQTVIIALNVLPPAVLTASPAPLSFAFQQGTPGVQNITVGSSGSAIAFAATATSQGGNWLSVSPPSGTTPANVTVSVNTSSLSAGTYGGAITITPTDPAIAPLTVNVSLVITPGVPSISSVVNSASFAPGAVSPGELITIFGAGMGPANPATLQVTAAGTVDSSLGGTQVFFDDVAAPMVYTSAGQVSAFVPYVATGSTRVRVQYLGVPSNTVSLRVIDAVPGIFTLDASGQGAILNQDTTINSVQNGAAPGSIVSIFATGEGLIDPPVADGTIIGSALSKPRLPVIVQIGGQNATVFYAGSAPGEPTGVLQVNAMVPQGVARNTSVPVVIFVGAAPSQSGVTIAIR